MRGEVFGALRRLGDVCLNSPRLKTVGRVELECVGITEAREAWVRAWGGAVMVGEWSAQASFARRVQVRSGATSLLLWLKVCVNRSHGFWSPLVTRGCVLEAVFHALSDGATGGRGVA